MGNKRDRESKEKDEKGPLRDTGGTGKEIRCLSFRTRADPAVGRFLEKLPADVRKRILKRIRTAQADPLHFYKRLEASSKYRLRIGDHRVIADIDFAGNIINIRLIGHRKKIYKNI
jgi:mRNA-degrading endonuclease RelE of RelBE toxin-antitoxin system